jgi:molecular chaperone DnaJ
MYGHAGVDANGAAGGGPGAGGFSGGFSYGPFGFGFSQGGATYQGNMDPEEIFDMFQGIFGGGGARRRRGRDLQTVMRLNFFEAIKGCQKSLNLEYVTTNPKTGRYVQRRPLSKG